uniref:Uncharacterized protein n=1 Tax=Anser brachyrhynchus TaxID=132585 RepID=A0A8B9B8U6_9AVES
ASSTEQFPPKPPRVQNTSVFLHTPQENHSYAEFLGHKLVVQTRMRQANTLSYAGIAMQWIPIFRLP